MKVILLAFFGLFSFSLGHCQAVEHLSHEDSIQLTKFWKNLSYCISHKNLMELKKLCHFPFNCNPCVGDSDSNKLYIIVDEDNFDKGRYAVFLDPRLTQTLKQYKLPRDLSIFHSSFNDHYEKRIGYNFSYIFFPETRTQPGAQVFVELRKFKWHYKITNLWMVP